VKVQNEPISGTGDDASNVAARIVFLGNEDAVLHDIQGRWAEGPQGSETGRVGISLEANQMALAANGVDHPLDVAFKVPGESCFYAFNDDNAVAEDHRLVERRLDVLDCRVRVTLRGSNVSKVSQMFDLHNDIGGLVLKMSDAAVVNRPDDPRVWWKRQIAKENQLLRSREAHGAAVAGEPGGEASGDGQVGVPPDAVDAAHAEGK
jgi:hypothetical protein